MHDEVQMPVLGTSEGSVLHAAGQRVTTDVGAVVIGRNEGDRLGKCLESLFGTVAGLVYVDSGSTDGSVELAKRMGATVVELDSRLPFTAARARNEGFRRLREKVPGLAYVQFVDGDCEVAVGWLRKAVAYLDEHHDVAAVCGRRRERYPERSIYNMLCDIEWDSPVGEAKACGGDSLIRSAVFEAIDGFRPDLIAGEEPEMCVRLRAKGWRVWRLDAEMTLHDAAMSRFWQWWKRTLRAGHAHAQGAHLHGSPPERHFVRESRRAWFWGFGVPVVVVGVAVFLGAWALIGLLVYPLQVIRLALRGRRSARENWWYAAALVFGKFPEAAGQANFLFHRWVGGQPRLIEYK